MTLALDLAVCRADYTNPKHASALVSLLDAYAQDPMGGGTPLSEFSKNHLIEELRKRPQAFSVLAFDVQAEAHPIGLVNCFEGFSTFACKPLVNVHDVTVLPTYRGLRVAAKMLDMVTQIALERGACKLTLEVLQNNLAAHKLYRRLEFSNYQLDPLIGHAQFLQKWLD